MGLDLSKFQKQPEPEPLTGFDVSRFQTQPGMGRESVQLNPAGFDFTDDDERRMSDALTISRTTGIDPETAYDLSEFMQEEGETRKRQGVISGLQEAYQRGQNSVELGNLRYQQVIGNDSPETQKRIKELKAALPKQGDEPDYTFGLPERALRAAAELIPIPLEGLKKGLRRGLVLGGGFAGVAALAGQLGPQVAFPEEIVTVPGAAIAGFGVGMTSGTLESIATIEAGLAYDEIMGLTDEQGNRISPATARTVAIGVGMINGLIEFAQIKTLMRTIPGGEKLLRTSIRKAVIKALTDDTLKGVAKRTVKVYGRFLAVETAQELLQETVTILGTSVATEVNNALEGSDIPPVKRKEVIDRLLKTAEQSVLAFSVLGIPGVSVTAARDVVETKRQGIERELAEFQVEEVEAEPLERFTDEDVELPPPVEPLVLEGQTPEEVEAETRKRMGLEPLAAEKAEPAVKESAKLKVKEYEGKVGRKEHITRTEVGNIDPLTIQHLKGEMGEVRGEHRNRTGEKWDNFKADIEESGIKEPILILKDPGEEAVVSEGNHRLDAAIELGLNSVPVDIRYFGHSEQEGLAYSEKVSEPEPTPGTFDADIKQEPPLSDQAEFEQVQAEARKRAIQKLSTDKRKQMNLVLADTRKEARVSIDLSPVYNSADEAVKQGGLSLDAIKQDYSQNTVNELLRWRPGLFTKKSTASPDSFATQFGFESVDEMVEAWMDAPTKAEAADNIAEQLRRQFDEQEGMDLEIDVMDEEMTILASMLAKRKHKAPGIKKTIREQTGMVREENMVTETAALKAAFKKSAQAARKAFSEGNKTGVEAEKTRMKQIIGNYKDKIKQMREADKTIRLIKRTRKQLRKGTKNIAVEYQKKLAKVFKGVELSGSKYANLERVARGLKQVMGEYRESISLAPERLAEIDRLAAISGKEMTADDIKSLRESVKALKDMGVVKAKLDFKYNEEMRQKALRKLLDSTHPIDPKMSAKSRREGELTSHDIFRGLLWDMYIKTLHTPRVTQIADGYKFGENTRLLRDLADGGAEAVMTYRARMSDVLDELRALDLTPDEIKDLSEGGDMAVRVNVVMLSEQKAEAQMHTLMAEHGIDEFPALSERETAVKDVLLQAAGRKTDEISAIFEEIQSKIFPRVEGYFPIKYEKEIDAEPAETIMQTRHRTSKVEQGFSIERVPGVLKVPRSDLLNILDEAVNDQEWYLEMQPRLENLRYLIFTEEYEAAAGPKLTGWWRDQTDIVARRGWSATAKFGSLGRALRKSRMNLNTAILGYRLSTIVMQPFAVFDAMAYMQSKFGPTATAEIMGEVMNAWIVPGYAKEMIKASPALRLRMGGELAIEETLAKMGHAQGNWKKFVRGSFKLLQKSDLRTAAGVEKGVLDVMKKHGIENPLKEAEFLMHMTQGSADVVYRPQILAQGEGARTWFTFQTFFLNRWGVIAHDLIATGLIKGGWKQKYNAALGLAILMAAGFLEDEAREIVYELTTGKELPEESFIKKLLLYLPRQIPFIGSILEMGEAKPPALRVLERTVKGTSQMILGKDAEARMKGGFRAIEGYMSLILGVPGTSQAFDLIERAVFEE